MKIEEFVLERVQSTWENQVEFNLSESGVQPLPLGELVEDAAGREALMAERLRYTQSNGTEPLRAAVAALYRGASADHVQVTSGGSEANFVTMWNLVEPGDEVVMMVPNYLQARGLARGFGGVVRDWPLVRDGAPERWRVDCDALEALVSPRTKLIAICNPNNPTGARIPEGDLDRICAIAAKHGSWLLADEIYRGAELDGNATASVWGRYDRAIITAGLSKAYGLPGLRIGWIVGPPARVSSLWAYHDYTTIGPAALSDFLARRALEPARRASLLQRTRRILNANYPILTRWLAAHGTLFDHVPPEAGAIAYVRYHHPISSTELTTRLRERHSVLVVPGDHFNMDGYLRIGFGEPQEYLTTALDRLHTLLVELGTPA